MPQEFGCASYIALEYYPAAGLSHQIAFDRFAGASSSIESDGFSNSFLIFSERAFYLPLCMKNTTDVICCIRLHFWHIFAW